MVNLCEAAGCFDSCCFGSYFEFSEDQFLLWCQYAGNPDLDELEYDSYRQVAALTDRRNGTGLILHSSLNVDGNIRHFVKVDGECPVRNPGGGCSGWGKFDACNRLLRASKRCSAFRKRDGLIQVDEGFRE